MHNPASGHGTPQAVNTNLGEGPAPPYHEPPPIALDPQQQHLLHQMQALLTPMQQELAERDVVIQNLLAQVEQLRDQIHTAPTQAPRPMLAVQARPPEEFTGDRTKFEGWISQLNLFFSLNRQALPTDRDRVLFACSYIKGSAYTYVKALVDSAATDEPEPAVNDYTMFYNGLQTVFGPVDEEGTAQRALQALRQKKEWSVEQYAAEFKRWQTRTGWNDKALCHHFRQGLQEHVRTLMIHGEQPTTIDELIRKASELDSRYRTAKHPGAAPPTVSTLTQSSTTHSVDPNAMDIGRMQISDLQSKVPEAEWKRRLSSRACLNCGKAGHRFYRCRSAFSPNAPSPRTARVATATTTSPSPSPGPAEATPGMQEQIAQLTALVRSLQPASPAASPATSGESAQPPSGF